MAVSNSIVKKDKPTFTAAISSSGYQKLIANTIKDPKRANRFIASVTSAVTTNPMLAECEASSIVSSALLGESLELSPSPQLGQFYLVPYNDNKTGTKKAQFQLGVAGYKQLAMRSGQYLDIDTIEVREGEYLGKDSSTGKPRFSFIEDDEEREKLPVIGYLAYFELLNGFKKSVYWSKTKIENHADKYSKAFSLKTFKDIEAGKIPEKDMWKYSSPWYSSFNDMALKTVLKNLLSKWGILSISMQTAIEEDSKADTELDSNIFAAEETEQAKTQAVNNFFEGEIVDAENV